MARKLLQPLDTGAIAASKRTWTPDVVSLLRLDATDDEVLALSAASLVLAHGRRQASSIDEMLKRRLTYSEVGIGSPLTTGNADAGSMAHTTRDRKQRVTASRS
jgi:hypothetical protein